MSGNLQFTGRVGRQGRGPCPPAPASLPLSFAHRHRRQRSMCDRSRRSVKSHDASPMDMCDRPAIPRSALGRFSRVVMHGSMCLLSNPRRRASVESGPRQRPRRGISRHPSVESGPHACVAAPACRVVHGTESDGGGAAGTLRSADRDSVEAGIRWVRSRHVLIGRRCRRGTRCAPHSLARGPATNGGRARLASGRPAPGPRDTGRHRLSTQDGSGRLFTG